MDTARLQVILVQFQKHRILVLGDFFLDYYLIIDPALNEPSIETGKTAYQIVDKRPQPGAAGTVCNNLSAMGIGNMTALSIIGDDGEGYELRKALQARRVNTDHIILTDHRFTPTYTKPMLKTESGEEELNRQDIKNRSALPTNLETQLQDKLAQLVGEFDAVIIADQVSERNCGVITDRTKGFLAGLAEQHPNVLFFADSRERIGEFWNLTIKPNRYEAAGAVLPEPGIEIPTQKAIEHAQSLRKLLGKPVYLTLDKEGICPIAEHTPVIVPCPPVDCPVDIVGAGDSVTAGIVSSLCSGATPIEAAIIGNLVASVTIRQLGTTGTASPEQILEAWETHQNIYNNLV